MSIKFSGNEIKYIALFENMTGAMVKDCIIDEENGKVTFVVKNGDMGLAIGKKGSTVTKVQKTVDKGVEIVEHSEDPIEFLKNSLAPAHLKTIKIIQKEDKGKIANIVVEGQNKGLAIGKNGQTIERAKLLVKRQHNISDVIIK
ncbi:MAG: NusA-like transcription termination signal-binding factor [Methanobrevibacter sp.]|nr:NusA-like transcription termination signal-binding factor [Methanobrevibacter sp.]